MKTKYHFNEEMTPIVRGTLGARLERAFQEYAARPMPKLDEKHLFDRSKHQLEQEAIRREVTWKFKKRNGCYFILSCNR